MNTKLIVIGYKQEYHLCLLYLESLAWKNLWHRLGHLWVSFTNLARFTWIQSFLESFDQYLQRFNFVPGIIFTGLLTSFGDPFDLALELCAVQGFMIYKPWKQKPAFASVGRLHENPVFRLLHTVNGFLLSTSAQGTFAARYDSLCGRTSSRFIIACKIFTPLSHGALNGQ